MLHPCTNSYADKRLVCSTRGVGELPKDCGRLKKPTANYGDSYHWLLGWIDLVLANLHAFCVKDFANAFIFALHFKTSTTRKKILWLCVGSYPYGSVLVGFKV